MKKIILLFSIVILSLTSLQYQAKASDSIVSKDVIFDEQDGVLAVEAEFFYKQTHNEIRSWYIIHKNNLPNVGRDDDLPHIYGSGNNAYLEILPDTRVTYNDELIGDVNFCGEPGKMGILYYKININKPGRYYVWVRAHSSGSEDNGIHVGIDGQWPASGQRMQWCEGKKNWRWESKQRTEKVHCGEPWKLYLDIKKAGQHEIMFSMREDGFEFDKFVMATDTTFRPEGKGPDVKLFKGTVPASFPEVAKDEYDIATFPYIVENSVAGTKVLKALDFKSEGTQFYKDQKKWMAINPEEFKEAETWINSPFDNSAYDIIFLGVGENDGASEYKVWINDKEIGQYAAPLSSNLFEEGAEYCKLWENIQVNKGDKIKVYAKVGTDGQEFSRGRWSGIAFAPVTKGTEILKKIVATKQNVKTVGLVTGELKKWHKITLVFDGPECSETDEYNPFFNYRLNVKFTHEKSGKSYTIPGYFAADGNAGITSAASGNKWKVHFAPDEIGQWNYSVDFKKGDWVAVRYRYHKVPSGKFMDGTKGNFTVAESDKTGRDFRAHGRLQYVGEGYLKFAETGKYFYKCGPDAPENFLSYYAFDGDFVSDGIKDDLVKTWSAHLKDWKEGNPVWSKNRGKEMIGALNYLASKGLNSVSFITNNIEGDDQNVFPYINYNTYDRFDCSKLDQWETVFGHAQMLGIFLHFKTLEAENQGLLDNGGIGGYTKLYYRELIARFGHHLALNWNLCEEIGDWWEFDKTRTIPLYATERQALAQCVYDVDAYHHHMVIHNGDWYTPMYGEQSKLTGASVQTDHEDFSKVNPQVKRVIDEAKAAGKVWAVACDEPGDHRHSLIPDNEDSEHYNARTNGLWGAMMAGGWGTEWYFGYEHPHSDLSCQDYRSRDLFWNVGAICINFFASNELPVNEMSSKNELISSNGDYCLAKEGDTYLIFLKKGRESKLNLKEFNKKYSVKWFDPRNGGELQDGSKTTIKGSGLVSLGKAPNNPKLDWVVLIQSK